MVQLPKCEYCEQQCGADAFNSCRKSFQLVFTIVCIRKFKFKLLE